MSNSRNWTAQKDCPYAAGSVDVATGATPEEPGNATFAQAFGAGPIDVYWALQDASTPPKSMAGVGSLAAGAVDVSTPASTFDGTSYDQAPSGVIALVSPVTIRCTLNASVFDALINRGLGDLSDVNGPFTYALDRFLRGNGAGAYVESVVPQSFPAHWKFSDLITATDPGTGEFKQNAATMAATTELYISNTTSGGMPLGELLVDVVIGQKVFLLQGNHVDRAAFYEVASTPVDNTGWWTIGVIYHAQGTGGEFQDGKTVTFQFVGIGGLGPQPDYVDVTFPTYAVFDSVFPAAAAVDFANGNKQTLDVTGLSLTFAAPGVGSFILDMVNSNLLTAITTPVLWADGTAPPWAGRSILSLYHDGTNWYGSAMVGVA